MDCIFDLCMTGTGYWLQYLQHPPCPCFISPLNGCPASQASNSTRKNQATAVSLRHALLYTTRTASYNCSVSTHPITTAIPAIPFVNARLLWAKPPTVLQRSPHTASQTPSDETSGGDQRTRARPCAPVGGSYVMRLLPADANVFCLFAVVHAKTFYFLFYSEKIVVVCFRPSRQDAHSMYIPSSHARSCLDPAS